MCCTQKFFMEEGSMMYIFLVLNEETSVSFIIE